MNPTPARPNQPVLLERVADRAGGWQRYDA
jgi:hypothetical protein